MREAMPKRISGHASPVCALISYFKQFIQLVGRVLVSAARSAAACIKTSTRPTLKGELKGNQRGTKRELD